MGLLIKQNLMYKYLNNKYLLYILCLINVVQLYSQKLYSKFDHITVDDGLSSNRIWSIYRDSKDYLWICTDLGLDKYDGYMFVKYRANEKQPGSISSNNIRNICEDSNKNLWFGSTEGLNLYDRTSGLFKVYKNIPSIAVALTVIMLTVLLKIKTRIYGFLLEETVLINGLLKIKLLKNISFVN